MTTKHFLALAAAGLIVAACSRTRRVQVAASPSDDIISRSIAAHGGLARIKAMRAQRMEGWISFDGKRQRFLVEIERPGRMRQEIGPAGSAMIETTSGTTGWLIDPAHGVREPRPLSTTELTNLAGGADLDGPFVDYRARGIRVEPLGTETVDGSCAYRYRVTMPDGVVRYQDLDCATYLDVRWQGTVHTPSGDRVAESYFRDYRNVGGVMVAFSITSTTEGTPGTQHIVLERVDINPPLDESRFGKP